MSYYYSLMNGTKIAIAGHHNSGSLKKPPFIPGLILSIEEQTLLKQIEATHIPDATLKLDILPLFHLAEHIIGHSCQILDSGAHEASWIGVQADLEISNGVTLLIQRLSCKMGYKCLGGATKHDVTVSILETLAQYSWEAKLVIALAAFSLQLRHLRPEIFKSQIAGAINEVAAAMLDVTRLVIEISEFPDEFRNQQDPLAVYWTIESTVAVSTLINLIATHGHEYMSLGELEPFTLLNKIIILRDNLEKFKEYVMHMLEEKREEETYKTIRKTVFNMVHPDNLAVLKALIDSKDDILPLCHGSERKRVPLSELKGKTVLLLVTNLDVTDNELQVLKKIYMESKTHMYSILWIPIVNTNNAHWESKFDSALSAMPWYSVHHASMVSNAATRFIKADLNFKGNPILVALDDKGTLNSMKPLNMMWIPRNNAFSISSVKEEALWKQETWNLELLFNNNDKIMNWIKEGKYIVVYGGDDIEWIQRFNKTAKEVSTSTNTNLELIYVGKALKNEKVLGIIAFMEAHKLGHYYESDMWFFWRHLESMLHSKIQMDKANNHTDEVAQEMKKLFSYDANVGAWAILAKGSKIVHSGEGRIFQEVFSRHKEWVKPGEHQFQYEFPTVFGKLPEKMRCPKHKQTLSTKIMLSRI